MEAAAAAVVVVGVGLDGLEDESVTETVAACLDSPRIENVHGVEEEGDGGFGIENVVLGDGNEVVCSVQGEHIVELIEWEENREVKECLKRIEGVVIEDENTDAAIGDPGDLQVGVKDGLIEEKFGSGEEEDDWEEIEMSELESLLLQLRLFTRRIICPALVVK